jgi:hypothetical protein
MALRNFSGGSVKQRMRGDLYKGSEMQWLTKILLLTGASFVVAERSKF